MKLDIEVRSSGPGMTFRKGDVPSDSAVRIMEYLTVALVLASTPGGVAVIIRRAA